jgi:dynein heavy chain
LKSLNNPPADVRICFFAVLNLYVGIEEGKDYGIPEQRGRINVKQEDSWKFSKNMMKDPTRFMENLNDYKRIIDEMRVPTKNFEGIQDILNDEGFTPENLKSKAEAAAGVCNWIKNINLYYDVVVNTEPKRQAVAKAEVDLAEATEIKNTMEALVAELQAKLDVLMKAYQEAMDKK